MVISGAPLGEDLGTVLGGSVRGAGLSPGLAATLLALADAGGRIAALIARGPFGSALAAETGGANRGGDSQKALDILANEIVVEALRDTPVAYLVSEEIDAIMTLDPGGELAIAVDPLDGSSNIAANISIGTIFSVFPVSAEGASASFLRPGREQLAAGYFIYGPHAALVLTTGAGTDLYVLDGPSRGFRLVRAGISIPPSSKEFAINASNHRHWFDPIRNFVNDCMDGTRGPRGRDFNMRWVASLVAEAHRVLSRGGVFLYPSDCRSGYERGWLRHVYEAAPVAMVVEQAGGLATDGRTAILDRVPGDLHERTPFVFGSSQEVELVASYHTDPNFRCQASPLFGQRGLFRD